MLEATFNRLVLDTRFATQRRNADGWAARVFGMLAGWSVFGRALSKETTEAYVRRSVCYGPYGSGSCWGCPPDGCPMFYAFGFCPSGGACWCASPFQCCDCADGFSYCVCETYTNCA